MHREGLDCANNRIALQPRGVTANDATRGPLRLLREPSQLLRALSRAARALRLGGTRGLAVWLSRGKNLGEALSYPAWIERHDRLDAAARTGLAARAGALRNAEVISLIREPLGSEESLRAALAAAQVQIHPRWELLLSCRADAPAGLDDLVAKAAAADPRMRALGRFPDRPSAWSAAIDAARGSHLCLLEDGTELRDETLLICAEEIAANPMIDVLYADHDRKSADGARCDPFFKGEFDPELLWSVDYLSPFALVRTQRARELGLRAAFAPAEKFDLLLRAAGRESARRIPHVLAHLGDQSYALEETGGDEARIRALQAHFSAALPGASVAPGPVPHTRRIQIALATERPLISVLVPTRDGVAVLRRCIDGLLTRTDWRPLELIVIDNGSRDQETLRFLDELPARARAVNPGVSARVLRDDRPFNFSALNNRAAREASGLLLALLNDDLEILDPSWLSEMAGHALRPEIGAVGARLLYPDGRVQHAGVATGVLGLAGHLLRGRARDDFGPHGWAQVLRGSSVVTAACMVLRRELFLDAGGFDERELPVAFNDVDLCLRLSRRGLRNLYVPTAELIHHESWSRGADLSVEKAERFAREMQTMLLRWPRLANDPLYSPNLSLADEQMAPGSPPRTSRSSP